MKSLGLLLCFCCAIAGGLERRSPSILVAILIRNKSHSLPYFLSYLEKLNYDKERIRLWIRSDHNFDNTLEVIDTWLNSSRHLYREVDYKFETEPTRRPDEVSPTHWSESRFADVIRMKEEALNAARNAWADYVFFLDADVLLTFRDTLKYLISLDLPIVAPMLKSDGLYSNFWGGMNENFYYVRTEDYREIINNNKIGEFSVPMVHSAVLVNVRMLAYENLTFNKAKLNERLHMAYRGPDDDIITFAVSANYSRIGMYVTNQESFGFLPAPLEAEESLEKDREQIKNTLMLAIDDVEEIEVLPTLQKFVTIPEKDSLGFSKIFMINLLRRSERRRKMESHFELLGLEVEHFPAVDGKEMTNAKLQDWGIEFLDGYVDPYHKRPMTFGEIGCFLSHYLLWERMVVEKLDTVLILEDDIKFEPYFRESTRTIMQQAQDSQKPWDLIYFGRKKLQNTNEPEIPGAPNLVVADYSYWTLGYVINLKGAQKLLAAEPLKRLLPVDEFLPIMFDRHPNQDYKSAFLERDLIAWSTNPLVLYPTRYTGEQGYISDTEWSSTIPSLEDAEGSAEKKGKKGSFETAQDELPEVVMSAMPHSVGHEKTEL